MKRGCNVRKEQADLAQGEKRRRANSWQRVYPRDTMLRASIESISKYSREGSVLPFDIETRQFTVSRPYFLEEGRMNVTGNYARHHRIPWDLLLDVLQRALEGLVDARVIGHLLTLSPRPTRDLATQFAAAAHQFRIGRPFQRGQGQTIVEVEQELFSLPCNLFQGLSNRADDPERLGPRFMDFTPSDVLPTGSLPEGVPGQLQGARERVFALLATRTIDPWMAQEACRRWRELWTIHGGGLNCATAHRHEWWAPGGMPFAQPPYRYWINAAGGALTAEQSSRLNLIVFRRAIG